MGEDRKFYVYRWIRNDLDRPFYIGKGKNDRAFKPKNNKYFLNIVQKCERLANKTLGGEGTTGYKFTEEQKNNIRNSLKGKFDGKLNPMYGKHHDETSIKKFSEAKCMVVIAITNEGKYEFNGVKECAEFFNTSKSNIQAWCSGRNPIITSRTAEKLGIKNLYYQDGDVIVSSKPTYLNEIVCELSNGVIKRFLGNRRCAEYFGIKPRTITSWCNGSRDFRNSQIAQQHNIINIYYNNISE